MDKTTPGSHPIVFGQTRAWQPPVCLNETTLAAVWSMNQRQRTKASPWQQLGRGGQRQREERKQRQEDELLRALGGPGSGEGSEDAGAEGAEPSGLGPGDREDVRPVALMGQPEGRGARCAEKRVSVERQNQEMQESTGRERGLRVGGRRAGG